jgi:cytochrome P450
MVLYPSVQREAQQELDRLMKPGHLPTLEDADNFPYVTALMREVLRWGSIVPLGELCVAFSDNELTNLCFKGAPRRVDRDITYKGYHIPAESIIVTNSWYVQLLSLSSTRFMDWVGLCCMTK